MEVIRCLLPPSRFPYIPFPASPFVHLRRLFSKRARALFFQTAPASPLNSAAPRAFLRSAPRLSFKQRSAPFLRIAPRAFYPSRACALLFFCLSGGRFVIIFNRALFRRLKLEVRVVLIRPSGVMVSRAVVIATLFPFTASSSFDSRLGLLFAQRFFLLARSFWWFINNRARLVLNHGQIAQWLVRGFLMGSTEIFNPLPSFDSGSGLFKAVA